MGEPLRLMVDLPNECDIINIHIYNRESKLIIASTTAGDGFVVPMNEVLAQTRSGKQVLNVKGSVKAAVSQNSLWRSCCNCRRKQKSIGF